MFFLLLDFPFLSLVRSSINQHTHFLFSVALWKTEEESSHDCVKSTSAHVRHGMDGASIKHGAKVKRCSHIDGCTNQAQKGGVHGANVRHIIYVPQWGI